MNFQHTANSTVPPLKLPSIPLSSLNPSIAVEGNSGAGKSTLCSQLARGELSVRIFPEFGDYVDVKRDEVLPEFPPTNLASLLLVNRMWPRIDLRRQAQRLNPTNPVKDNKIDVIDTTALSVFAYEVTKATFGYLEGVQDLAKIYNLIYEKEKLQQPSHWVFLFANNQQIYDRLVNKGGTRPFLFRLETMKAADCFRRYFITNYLKEGEYTTIENSSLSPDQLRTRGTEVILNFNPSSKTDGLRRFIRDLTSESFITALCATIRDTLAI